ncbi:MAG: hypothetical protein ABWY57_15825 [Mycetocola sp.]
MSLAEIALVGTRGKGYSSVGKPSNKIKTTDGFSMSVIAGGGAYCSPRPGFGTDDDYEGPYTHVEVGFPTQRPEPWAEWEAYAENPHDPTDTVYSWVPVESVAALIALHGGEVTS